MMDYVLNKQTILILIISFTIGKVANENKSKTRLDLSANCWPQNYIATERIVAMVSKQ